MTLHELTKQLLVADGLEFDETGPALRLAYTGNNGRFLLAIRSDEERRQVVCFALSPIDANARREAASELVHRLNATLNTVAFDIDVDNGAVRCRGGVDVEGAMGADSFVIALISNVVYAVAAAMDQALPALTAVIVQGLEPRRAMDAVV